MTEVSRVQVWRNTLTVVGLLLFAVSLFFTVSLSFFDFFRATPSPYIGIFTFLIFPILMVAGVVLAITGFFLRRHRLRRELGGLSELQYYPHIDFNDSTTQRWLAGLLGASVVFLGFFAVMSYEGFHYTESNDFCGQVCHAVMHPEFTAHQYSPHARVQCVDCHVGSGAVHYVESKIAGVRQILAVMTASYTKPLPPALTTLRPSAETCEQCHWPKYFGEQLVTQSRYGQDEDSSPQPVRMIIKTGGSHADLGGVYGIHAHMVGERKIEFVATDDSFQDIPWVRVLDTHTGEATVYRSDGLPEDEPPPAGPRRKMDCLDCHNRAVHTYVPPTDSADTLLQRNPEIRKLPFAKRALVGALTTSYDTREAGLAAIPASIESYYRGAHPEVLADSPALLEELKQGSTEIYRRTFFPGMNVDWRTYPANNGHRNAPGCFRCHAGDHVDSEGTAIVHECSSCHDFLVLDESTGRVERTSQWRHPVELEGVHGEILCSECHTGGLMSEEATCEGCHVSELNFMAGSLEVFDPFEVEADPMDGMAECTDCHDLSSRMSSKKLNDACIECHEGEDYAEPGIIAEQRREIRTLIEAVDTENAETRRLLDLLREAGPLHNLEASRKILTALAQQKANGQ